MSTVSATREIVGSGHHEAVQRALPRVGTFSCPSGDRDLVLTLAGAVR